MPQDEVANLIASIEQIPLFNGLSYTQIEKLLAVGKSGRVEAGEPLRADTPGGEMYILTSGQLAVTQAGQRVATVVPVSTVGEMGMVGRSEHSARIEALEVSTFLRIPRSEFDALLRDNMDIEVRIYRNIIEILAGKIINDNVRTRDYMEERVNYAKLLKEHRILAEGAMDLLEHKGGMDADDARSVIAGLQRAAFLRVLIVDDEPAFRRFAKQALATLDVVEATDGKNALEAIARDKPDLVVTDIRMPKMDGVALLARIREQHPDLPVVAISGYANQEELEQLGFDGFIAKPVAIKEFRHDVEVALTTPRSG
jgi:CheY-like chemotaxis protein